MQDVVIGAKDDGLRAAVANHVVAARPASGGGRSHDDGKFNVVQIQHGTAGQVAGVNHQSLLTQRVRQVTLTGTQGASDVNRFRWCGGASCCHR